MARKKAVVKQVEGEPHLPTKDELTQNLKLKKINLNDKQKEFLSMALDPQCQIMMSRMP